MRINLKSHGVKTPDALIFRHLRITGGLTVKQLAKLIGCDRSYITHYESGRNGVSAKVKLELLKVFSLSEDELRHYQEGLKPIPINYKDECMAIIYRLDEKKLMAIYHMLVNFKS